MAFKERIELPFKVHIPFDTKYLPAIAATVLKALQTVNKFTTPRIPRGLGQSSLSDEDTLDSDSDSFGY